MADLRIVDAPVLLQESITDDVKMPTGGLGNFSIRLGDIVWYVVTKEQLANKNYVDLSSKGVKDSLDEHIADKANPHNVTKAQVGLGNVDNTADVDKPVSDATKSAIITATTDMATKTYVNQKDNLKADKATTLSGYGITDAYTRIQVDSKTGDLTTLKTTDKTNLVKAVNEIHGNTKGVVALYDKNIEVGGGANGWSDTLILVSENVNQRQINDGIESITAMLAIENPRNGQRVYVKSYHTGLNKGGGTFVYDVTKEGINDGGVVINGWVRQLDDFITPTMFGAKADGVADERLICEKSVVAASTLKKRWVVDKEDVYLLNSYANYSSIAHNAAGILPIFSDVTYDLQGTLKVGSFFDDKDFMVFNDINNRNIPEMTPVTNWKITGNGVIDLSLSGKRRTTFKIRCAIYLYKSVDALIEHITIRDGDLSNAIVTDGKNVRIDKVKFINLMQENSANDDHSSIYGKAADTHVTNCTFIMSSINGLLNACPVELHNSNSSFSDSTVYGYRNAVIVTAIAIEYPNINNIQVHGIKANVLRHFVSFDVWTESTLENVQVHDNVVNMLMFPSDVEITDAGFRPDYVKIPKCLVHLINDSKMGYDLVPGKGKNINVYNNTYNSMPDPALPHESYQLTVFLFKSPVSGVSVYNNTLSTKRLLGAYDGVTQIGALVIDDLKIYDNFLDVNNLAEQELISLYPKTIKNCYFNIELKSKPLIDVRDVITISPIIVNESTDNTFIVCPNFIKTNTEVLHSSNDFFELPSNKFSYPSTVPVYFGGEAVTEANFYRDNVKQAKVIERLDFPDNVMLSDFMANKADNKLSAICLNPNRLYGTYNTRLLLSNY